VFTVSTELRVGPKIALFPVSLDSKLFRTSIVSPALEALLHEHDGILFLITDSLQIYNKLWSRKQRSLTEAFGKFERLRQSYLAERMKWIAGLNRQMLGPHPSNWVVRSSYEYMDADFWKVYQRIVTLHCLSRVMREDIERSAMQHVTKQGQLRVSKTSRRLSEAYILEELALSVRVRVCDRIGSEFYLGEYPRPLLRLYDASYGIDVSALAGINTNGLEFNFFTWQREADNHGRWRKANKVHK
jgi:hypothetical protein